LAGDFGRVDGFGHRELEEAHPREAQAGGERLRARHQFFAGFDAPNLALRCREFKKQVVQDEAEVGLACAVVDQAQIGMLG